jgi:hypothetical protein
MRQRYRAQLLDAARLVLQQPGDAGALATLLYDRWYAPASGPLASDLGSSEVAAHLRAADAAGGRFEQDWIVVAPEDARARIGPAPSPWQVAAARGGEVRWIDPVDLVLPGGVGLRPPVGTSIAVSDRRDSVRLLPGWWTSMSPAWALASPPLVRLYWSVEPECLCQLVESITACLDPSWPYALKCPLELDRCRRPDAVVVFLPSAAWPAARGGLAAAHRLAAAWLRPRVPALTLELAPGLALAEDPGDDSFGMDRCRTIASALGSSRQAGVSEPGHMLTAAVAGLLQRGISDETPWRNPGSTTAYPWDGGNEGNTE